GTRSRSRFRLDKELLRETATWVRRWPARSANARREPGPDGFVRSYSLSVHKATGPAPTRGGFEPLPHKCGVPESAPARGLPSPQGSANRIWRIERFDVRW